MKLLIALIIIYCLICASIASDIKNSIDYSDYDYKNPRERDEFEGFPECFKENAICIKKEIELNQELAPIIKTKALEIREGIGKYTKIIDYIQDNFTTSFDFEETQNLCLDVKNHTYELLNAMDNIFKSCIQKEDKNFKMALNVLRKGFDFVCTLSKIDFSYISNLSSVQKCTRDYEWAQEGDFKYKLYNYMNTIKFNQGLCDWKHGEIYDFVRNGLLLQCVQRDDFFVRSLDYIYNSFVEECNIYNAI